MRLPFFQRKPAEKTTFNYQRLLHSAEDETIDTKYHPVRTKICFIEWRLGSILLIWNIFLLAFGAYGIRAYMLRNKGVAPKVVTCYCGESIAEAKALGCKYDSLSVSWLPPHCRDEELIDEFDHAGPGPNGEWMYWADVNATERMTLEEIGLLANLPIEQAVFYSSYGWHVAHCAFSWRKEFRMRAKGLMMEKRYDKESHIDHCYSWFMREIPLAQIDTPAYVALGGEGSLSTEESAHEHN